MTLVCVGTRLGGLRPPCPDRVFAGTVARGLDLLYSSSLLRGSLLWILRRHKVEIPQSNSAGADYQQQHQDDYRYVQPSPFRFLEVFPGPLTVMRRFPLLPGGVNLLLGGETMGAKDMPDRRSAGFRLVGQHGPIKKDLRRCRRPGICWGGRRPTPSGLLTCLRVFDSVGKGPLP